MKEFGSVERLARLGYVCKGAVYVIIGLLAAASVVGRGQVTDRQGAVRFILDYPFGHFVLLVMAIGLSGYAAWRVISGVGDSERHGNDAKGVFIRIGSVLRGLFYGWFAIELARQALRHGGGGKSSDRQTRHLTARLMDQPFGRWAVAIAGACVIGYGAYQLYCAVTGKLSKKLPARSIPPALLAISRFGLGARAIIFGIIGGSLISAAFHYSASRATGTPGAMRTIAAQPFGGLLLVLVGVGFAAYGVYAFVNARYRNIAAP